MPMKFPLPLLLFLLFPGEPQAQVKQKNTPPPHDAEQAKKSKVKERTPPPEAEAIIADARIAPPEFAADALIRVARSPKVADAELKRELLEEAFRLASD